MRIIHVTHHNGCAKELEYVANKLDVSLETKFANWHYNVTQELADSLWVENKQLFETFDLIITSDTAPLSRIFLRDEFKKKLFIWICNRFDYTHQTPGCTFPDSDYYKIFANAISKNNVKIAGYTDFECIYARLKGIPLADYIIKPTGGGFLENAFKSQIPVNIIKNQTFFIPSYHNDRLFMDLNQKCQSLGIISYAGRYGGPEDLKDFKGIIHIPYAWSNLALFEGLQRSMVYFIPSKEMIVNLSRQHNFFWSPPFIEEYIDKSEWYHEDYKECFVYFNSWEDLRNKVQNTNFENKKKIILQIIEKHIKEQFDKWKKLFNWAISEENKTMKNEEN